MNFNHNIIISAFLKGKACNLLFQYFYTFFSSVKMSFIDVMISNGRFYMIRNKRSFRQQIMRRKLKQCKVENERETESAYFFNSVNYFKIMMYSLTTTLFLPLVYQASDIHN